MKRSYDDLPLMLRVDDVASILRISKTVAYELVNNNDFPCVRVGRHICIPRDRFLRWSGLIE